MAGEAAPAPAGGDAMGALKTLLGIAAFVALAAFVVMGGPQLANYVDTGPGPAPDSPLAPQDVGPQDGGPEDFDPEAPDRGTAAEQLSGDRFLVGAWLGDWPKQESGLLPAFEESTGAPLDVVDTYMDWYTPAEDVGPTLIFLMRQGIIPQVSWEPHGFTTVDILDGTKKYHLRDDRQVTIDQYIDEFAAGLCDVATYSEQPIILRTMHEMNGAWYTWGQSHQDAGGNFPNTPETYVAAWRKIHDAVTSQCSGVEFLWAINHASQGAGVGFMDTYPGDGYVDYVGIDGYNWGSQAPWGWKGFASLFTEPYCAATQATGKPILIAEIASVEAGGDKPAWIAEMFRLVTDGSFARVRGLVWFNDEKTEVEVDQVLNWRVDSTQASLEAFAKGVEQAASYQVPDPSSTGPGSACSFRR